MNVQMSAAAPLSSESLTVTSRNTPSNPQSPGFQAALADASAETSKIADVAKQFEGLIAGQVLKAARESSDGGWLGNEDDQTGELTLEMAEQAFSQALASQGAFGIAKMVTAALKAKTASSGSASAPPPAPRSTEPVS